ncbi:unnamed protein product [Vicia faba]|uniref:RRM domain-containing protein n=1 Tax=Vicia faba TaxID=3906 RepID=A0AAV0YJG4_VICFA|nr:unnamed protein product [Vicia faba]
MAEESKPVCEDAIPPQKIGNKREYEDDDQKEVIAKKTKTCEKLKAKIESDTSGGSLESFDDGVSDPNSNKSPDEDNPEDLESLEGNEEEVEGKVSKTPQERHGSPITLNEKYVAQKTICVRNLSYSVERADMEDIFKDCGEVVDVEFKTDSEGRFRGFGFVKFGTVEAAEKALNLHNTELLNRRIKVEIAREKREYPPYRSLSSSFHTGGNLHSHTSKGFDASLLENKAKSPSTPKETKGTSKTVYVGNLSYTVERADVEKLFKDYGEIVDVRLYTDREGKFKGHGHVQFATEEAAQKALALKNKVFFKRSMIVDLAFERPKYSPNGSSAWSNSFHKDERFQSQTVPVKCLDTSLAEGKLSCAKEVKDVEMFDAISAENKPEIPATRIEKSAASKRVCVRNLSFAVERAEIENIFKDCGVVVDVRLHVDVEFATAETAEKALELDYTRLTNNPVKVGIAPGEGEHFSNRSSLSIQFQQCEPLTVYVVGFNTFLAEEKIKASLHNHFKSCGEIARISLPKNRDSGIIKGHAYLNFKDLDGYKKALQLDQTAIGDHWVSVEKAKPMHRRDNQDICGGRGNYGLNHRHDNHDVGGSYLAGGRDGPSYLCHNQGRGGYHVGGWDEANYRRDNQGMGGGSGSYHVGRRGEGDYGGGREVAIMSVEGLVETMVVEQVGGEVMVLRGTGEGIGRNTAFAEDDYCTSC